MATDMADSSVQQRREGDFEARAVGVSSQTHLSGNLKSLRLVLGVGRSERVLCFWGHCDAQRIFTLRSLFFVCGARKTVVDPFSYNELPYSGLELMCRVFGNTCVGYMVNSRHVVRLLWPLL